VRLVWTTVAGVLSEDPGIQRLSVEPPDAASAAGAICYPALTGPCAPGDRVLLNTTAVDLALGTGGWHFVVGRDGAAGVDSPSGGHVMKARYTPLQVDVLSVEEHGSASHDVMAAAMTLGGMPVVCCGLHSQLAPAAAAVKAVRPDARVAYVMSDAASLPLPLSDLVRDCRAAGLLDGTVSCGQAFGGELEAVTLHSGLLAARHVLGADVAVVANGPGVTGTDTPFGHGGVAQAEAINAAGALDGRPIAVLRVSFADPRERHRGVSHHTLGVLGTLALAPALVAMPPLPPEAARAVESALEEARVWDRHERATAVEPLPATRGVALRTMGRTPAEDPAFFAAAAAAGEVAARLVP
jgi:hypothetical protein